MSLLSGVAAPTPLGAGFWAREIADATASRPRQERKIAAFRDNAAPQNLSLTRKAESGWIPVHPPVLYESGILRNAMIQKLLF